ncbi:uncharacterized protein LOC115647194 isoform X1 [Gopherus evgoodei]|uniref:uncharacterized protein LOC115647194 isoform X1 n=1 Tax=Gopherus evgoodei TaxID=1825980 RepID=UPI0011D0209E|nr:uncharacterized protein LOC115647194 isoform X1 [Gopherus evgoodei]XP_030409851.1 uncharacterized protein LOC115647194 isoform X1 [Gopherus evgoodei]XP_030409852.1 uncharacterized protein LOC115647194 isoform X1 [Gopherus evgoodei]XP_030409853.1 uncharacterized protein LOC115647194 isoform X1 [Gopherus evgoodei]XP_030409854.1 uncharacterized protein LOC115647194 isoform X1 [Gopherus evgoodei]
MATVPPPGLKFKLILLGDFGVGKTTLFHRIQAGRFLQGAHAPNEYLAVCKRTVRLSHPQIPGLVQISLWDTAGEERFLSLSSCYYRDADAVLLLYSVQSQLSFDSLPHWVYVARQYCPDGRGPGATPAVRGQRGPSSQSPLRRSRLCSLPDSGFPRPADVGGAQYPSPQIFSHGEGSWTNTARLGCPCPGGPRRLGCGCLGPGDLPLGASLQLTGRPSHRVLQQCHTGVWPWQGCLAGPPAPNRPVLASPHTVPALCTRPLLTPPFQHLHTPSPMPPTDQF